jgi:putative transposase
LAKEYPRRGFKKFYDELRQGGRSWNHKRVYRIYREMGLNLRRKPKKRLPSREAKTLIQPNIANDCWSMDFMSDATTDGRKFRTFNVIDDFNREALVIRIARSFPAVKIIEILDEVASWRGYPKMIRTDNGPEYISKEFAVWAKNHGIELRHIQPGKPAQNGYVERFNRTYREEVLDMYLFGGIEEAEIITEKWLKNYNCKRPHEALNSLAPVEFARLHGGTPMRALEGNRSSSSQNLNISTNNWF